LRTFTNRIGVIQYSVSSTSCTFISSINTFSTHINTNKASESLCVKIIAMKKNKKLRIKNQVEKNKIINFLFFDKKKFNIGMDFIEKAE
jgi:hypothetical protein